MRNASTKKITTRLRQQAVLISFVLTISMAVEYLLTPLLTDYCTDGASVVSREVY